MDAPRQAKAGASGGGALSHHLGRPATHVSPEGGESMTPEDRHAVALERCAHTLDHPVGTARMGKDEDSAVDPQLRVRSVEILRMRPP
jgi:choline dehydrogenase-like flavoprotein